MTTLYIETATQLAELCKQIENSLWLAVDTEFHREKTYYPELCLIQIANDDVVACIDPLAIEDLTPLFDIFYNPKLTLVFHAARQDLELFYMIRNALPQQVFDTQLAATVLGYGDQIGYGNLVKQCLNVDLEKAHSRTDWRQRPLSQGQIDYAADDVRYLRSLYHLMLDKLNSTGRLNWLKEDFSALAAIETYAPTPDTIWRKVKGAGKLKGKQLAVLQQLASWREQLALKQNLPRKWILKDEIMLDIARFAPTHIDKLQKIRGFEQRDIKRHGHAIISLIEKALLIPKEQWPVITKPTPLSNQQDAVVDVLMGLLRQLCDGQSITPSAVATRKEIESLVRGEDVSLKHGWRKQIVGEDLMQFLSGEVMLSATTEKLTIQ